MTIVFIQAMVVFENDRVWSSSPISVFELRKNKWLSHGQPGYNFWLSLQVFGCPYFKFTRTKVSFGNRLTVVHKTTAVSIFGCLTTFLVVGVCRYEIIKHHTICQMCNWMAKPAQWRHTHGFPMGMTCAGYAIGSSTPLSPPIFHSYL